jgi:fibro-slime domain-containing protein
MDTYINRNFNYALACNGEFVYHEKDNLFFEFEGDDDVYLFINGEIVLDLGGAHSISNESLDVNVYVEWAREVVKKVEEAGGDYAKAGYTAREYERAQKLDLIEGEICQFDFYYMERHGYGANCRIVTNMRVTDPALRTEKNAAQKNEDDQLEDIPYGGAIAFEEPIAYNFKLTNTGNTKLYNLTFEDKEIGVKLDYINGLQVTGTYQGLSVNGFYVLDKTNGELTASDLTADVVGYQFVGDGNGTYRKTDDGKYIPDSNGSYNYTTVKDITFKDNQALINFLKTLAADGTDDTLVDEEKTQQGAGLWVDASVTIKGIYYLMTDENVDVGFFDNTVYVSATTRVDPNSSGSHTLRSSANHRVYISGDPVYFQWADHDLYLNLQMILSDSTKAAGTGTGGQLSQYQEFFKAANYEIGNVNTIIADKNGNLTSYNEVKWAHTRDGVLVNYSEAGTQAFYLYMSLKNENYNGEPGIQDGEYAIIRVTVNVASVKDSVYVLDYGLRSENLDTGNELFKNDQLLGADSGTVAKLMGISTVQPYYLDYTSNQKSYNRINFESTAISSTGRIWTNTNQNDSQGCWTVKMDIPESGRQITYSAYTGGYSLTDAGTVGIHVDAPFTWDDVYLYWWYNNGVSNGAFPGQHMNRSRAGKFNLDIPADVPHLIISHPVTNENGETVYLQTDDLNLVSGRDAWITIDGSTKGGTINSADHLNADVSYSTQTVNMHANVPAGWGDVYLYYRNEQGTVDENHPAWPGVQMMPNSDGSYSAIDLPGDISHIIVNDGGNNKQTDEITVFAGSEIWINVAESTNANWYVSNNSVATSTPIKISGVPADWTDVYLYYWTEGIGDHGNFWPGTKLTETDDAGNYVFDLPMNIDRVIITNNNGMQTQNLVVAPGRETTITLDANLNATMKYNTEGTFTVNAKVPAHWGDNVNLHYWDAMNNGYSEVTWPGKAMGVIHNNYTGETTYTLTIPNYATHVVINDGTNQSGDLTVVPGSTNEISFSATYNATLLYTQEKVKIHATVPESWKEGTSSENPLIVSLYCWDNNDNKPAGTWPGTAMILEDINGTQWYTLEVPANVTNVIINNNNNGKQTADLTITEGLETWIEVNDKTKDEGKYTAAIGYGSSAGEEGFFFTPINFMDKAYYLYMAVTIHDENETPTPLGKEIDIHNELQMFKKITVLPANVVYYEDDFHGIVYDTTTGNQFSSIGEGSGSLSQSVDQKMEYGQDPYYGNGVNDAYSGDSLTKIQINNTKDVASFTFSGTGFEIIGRTNATDAGTMMVKVYDAKEYATAAQAGTTDALVPYMQVPVINEFDNGSNGGLDSIEQVPVIRISKITDASGKNLGYGAYTVVINGIPTYNFQNWDGNVDNMPLKETYLYIDGIRIFQPYNNGVSELYRPAESGAGFYEIHDMILDKQVFVISTKETAANGNKTIQISGGMNTWTENRNGLDQDGNVWVGNIVNSNADYMFAGPNNEAYLAAVQSNPSALAFYVQETNSANKELQVAVRAIDYGSFFGNTSTGLNAQLQLGVITEDGSFAWVSLASVMSGTEQYYTIPYTNCPFDRANDRYQIVLRVVNGEGLDVTGMVSLTSLKTNGLTIPTLSGDQYELTYNAAGNALVNAVNGETVDTGKYVNFKMVLNQMNSNVVIDDDFLPDSIVPGTSGSDKTGFGLAGANMHLGNSLSMNFFVNKADLVGTDYYAVITRYTADGVETVTVPYEQWDDRNTMFAITLSNLAARQMTDKVAVVIYNANGTQVSQIWTDSVQDYAMRILDNSDAETKTVLVDMLNYGAAAQIYFGYRTENLANSLLTAEQKACATQNVVCADQSVKGVNSVGSSLMLKEQIVLTQYFKNVTADMYAVVSFKDHKGNAHETRVDGSDFVVKGDLYGVDVKDLVIADGDQMVTVTVYDAQGNVVASATDSINSYCARQLGDDALFESVVKFTTSAYAFFH